MFTYDDVYNTLEPTLFAISGELLYSNYSTFRCRIVFTIRIVITLESDNPMCSVLLFD